MASRAKVLKKARRNLKKRFPKVTDRGVLVAGVITGALAVVAGYAGQRLVRRNGQ